MTKFVESRFGSLLPHKSSLLSLLACCKWCITFTSSWFRILKMVSVRPSVRAPVFLGHCRFPLSPTAKEGNRHNTSAWLRAARCPRSRCIQKAVEADSLHSIIPYSTELSPHRQDQGEGEIGYCNTKKPGIRHQHCRIWRRIQETHSWSCRATIAY